MSIAEKNRLINIKSDSKIGSEFINGQAMGIVPNFRYGLFSMAYNGCEVIAVYNALIYCKKAVKLSDIAFAMEKYRMVYGVFGCNPYCFDKLSEKLGLKASRVYNFNDTSAFIISFWCGKPFISGIHTMFCTCSNGRITVYNRYNQDIHKRVYPDFKSFAGSRKIISIYSVAV